MPTAPTLSLKARALRYLAAREYSRLELAAKLARYSGNTQEAREGLEQLLDELSARGYINPARVVESTIHRRASKYGAQRVLGELRRKGLDDDQLRAAAAELGESELTRACAVWTKKFGFPPSTPSDYARQARFLVARGFEAQMLKRVIIACTHSHATPEASPETSFAAVSEKQGPRRLARLPPSHS